VSLDDGHPLHRSTKREVRGREVTVCRAVANVLDARHRSADVERFIETLRRREGLAA
jgi:hypothetical protein